MAQEREVLLTGIGGQGVQLAAQVLARAATLEGRHVQLFGVYGGMMRGGNSDSTVVVADGPIESPPIVSHAWSALLLHSKYWQPLAAKLRDGAVLLVNSSLFEDDIDARRFNVVPVPATAMAEGAGKPLTVSMVLLGAYVATTGLVALDAAVDGMRASVPPYRRQHVADNEDALRRGFDSVPPLTAPAWQAVTA